MHTSARTLVEIASDIQKDLTPRCIHGRTECESCDRNFQIFTTSLAEATGTKKAVKP